ncbi:hypothetical protein GCM10023224_15890 [Streptomonospora halophila]|uniref:Histidine kinase/HSP90-like ATPase domain-containing protein n=1 Tax=Streptomonospora halophila TaxID=427369 RepID=A0ABP9GBU3_9ACTN
MDTDVVERCREPDYRFAATARRSALPALARYGLRGDSLDEAELMISELVTNALQHGACPIAVLVWSCAPDCVVVEVHDTDPDIPALPAPRSLSEVDMLDAAGRGLPLVTRLSQRCCGVEALPLHGKSVWFGLALTSDASVPRSALAPRIRARIHARHGSGHRGRLAGPRLL